MPNELHIDQIQRHLHRVRGKLVMLDSDLAALYGVPTKVFNQAVKRNAVRFPDDFAFQLDADEWMALKSQFVTSKGRGGRTYLPFVFTEHGALMAANLLNSPQAVAMSVFVIRAFVQMREELSANQTVLKRLAEIDRTLLTHDTALRDIYQKLLPLLAPPPEPPRRRIGFNHGDK